MRRWKLSEQNFENCTVRGFFQKKRKNCCKDFQVLRLQAAITTQRNDYRSPEIHYQNNPPAGYLVSIFRINSTSFPWAVCRVQRGTRKVLSTFSTTFDVRYWVNHVRAQLTGEDLSRYLNYLNKWIISRFKRSIVLAPDRQSGCKCCKMFTFPCPITWRPERQA